MSDDRYTLRDLVVENPAVDHALPLLAAGAWFLFARGWDPANVNEFLIGLATVSGLVLTAATFVCTLTYQSSSERVLSLRVAYGPQIRRNWTSIFLMVFLAAVLPLVALLFVGSGPTAPLLAVWSGTMLSIKSYRTLYWLKTMLFMQFIEDRSPAEIRSIGSTERRNTA